MRFKPTVLAVEPERELRWLDRTRLGFERMNAALKARAGAAER